MAKQADGAVLVRLGDTVVLATACAQQEPRAGVDFLPLTVDYRENTYAAGKIPGGFFKREGRPNEKEILTSRMIDRPLRPLFPEGYNKRDPGHRPAPLRRHGERLRHPGHHRRLHRALPLRHPVRQPGRRGARRATGTGRCVVNPSSTDLRTKSKLNLLVAGTEDAIVMVESGAQEISEEVMVQALAEGHDAIKQIVALQKELRAAGGQAEAARREEGDRPRLRGLGRERRWPAPLLEAMQHDGQARVLRAR